MAARITKRLKRITRMTAVRRTLRYGRRYARRNPRITVVGIVGLVILLIVAVNKQPEQRVVSLTAYQPLLETIAEGESRGNYNAYYGNTANQTIRFTDMTIAQVLQWQHDFVSQGSPSSAVGKYQIVESTLRGLVRQLQIAPEVLYDEVMQDRLAVALLERRGSLDYVDNMLTREQFAANLAQEWAALPRVIGGNPQDSYYAGDGLNQSRISVEDVFVALQVLADRSKL